MMTTFILSVGLDVLDAIDERFHKERKAELALLPQPRDNRGRFTKRA